MDIALFAVTVISLTMAFAMGIVTWRLLREERRRADARIASLMSELERVRSGRQEPLDRPAGRPTARGVGDTPPDSIYTVPSGRRSILPDNGLFATEATDAPPPGRPLLGVAAVGVVATAIAIGALWPSAQTAAPASTSLPVELLSLDHAREGDFLAIRGTIRNPADGMERRQLSVAATVFSRDGDVVGRGQTPLDIEVLQPGREIPFKIALPDADRINRYRVSFIEAQSSLPHVDRRGAGDQP